jgi:hypothetical protein
MLPQIEIQTFCKQIFEIDNSDPPEYVKHQLDLDKTVCTEQFKHGSTSEVGKIGYRKFTKFNKANGAEIPLEDLTYLLFSTLCLLTPTEYLSPHDWYYHRGLNFEPFCLQIILAWKNNHSLIDEWKMMEEFSGCFRKNKIAYVLGVIE